MLTRKKLYSWSIIYVLLVAVIFLVLLYADKTRTESSMGILVKNMEPGLRLLFISESPIPAESRTLIGNRIFENLQSDPDTEAFTLEKDGAIQMSWVRGKEPSAVSWVSSLDQMIWTFTLGDLSLTLKGRLASSYKYPLYFLIALVLFIFILVFSYTSTMADKPKPDAYQPIRRPDPDDHYAQMIPLHEKTVPLAYQSQHYPDEHTAPDSITNWQEDLSTASREHLAPMQGHTQDSGYFAPEHASVTVQERPLDASQILFDIESGVSNGDIFPYRLKKELERASENAQDLSLVYLRLIPAETPSLQSGVKLLLEEFTHEDLIFRLDEATFALILPQLDFDQSIAHLEMLYRKLERLQNSMEPGFEHLDIMSGLSSRNGRLVEPDRLMEESRTALTKADRKKGRIVGFRPDPSKFRNFLKHTKV